VLPVRVDPINSTDPTGLTKLEFDVAAGTLYVDPENGTPPYTMSATSGVGGMFARCRNNVACEREESTGPTYRGKYKLKPRNRPPIGVTERGNPAFPAEGDWGSFRVRLIPDAATKAAILRAHRDPTDFYLHGGRKIGTKGCIDVGGGESGNEATRQLIRQLRADPDNNVPLIVR
jgi:hypothetical protein